MRCPKCGTQMNRHAEKPIKDTRDEDSSRFDPTVEGVIEAVHTCPGCGHVEVEVEK